MTEENRWKIWIPLGGILLLMVVGCRPGAVTSVSTDASKRGRTVIKYWEKWTGNEGAAMKAIVADFNASQDRIQVEYLTTSAIDRKLLMATAGGNPPDVASLWSWIVPTYVEQNALLPLDRLAREAGLEKSDYIDVFWDLCTHRRCLWALPSAPYTIALHWNKKLFREAGLDPERPPRSIAELEEYNKKLTKRRPDGSIECIGHIPEEPGWWNYYWCLWFGGDLWDHDRRVTADSAANLAAMEWVQSYPKRFGVHNLIALREGYGSFSSPQNPFFTGKVAMILQGSWMYNWIKAYGPPDFEWGVAPFPSVDPEKFPNVTIAECDILAIPVGSQHPREAFEFIRYVSSQGPMEKFSLAQRKFSPLKKVSPDFFQRHENPYIRNFLELAKSPNAKIIPRLSSWVEYKVDLMDGVSKLWTMVATPSDLMPEIQMRQQKAVDRRSARWDRLEPELVACWKRHEKE